MSYLCQYTFDMNKGIILLAAFLIHFTVTGFARIEDGDIEKLDQSIQIPRISDGDIAVDIPSWMIEGMYGEIKIRFISPTHPKLVLNNNVISIIINSEEHNVSFNENGEAVVPYKFSGNSSVKILAEDFSFNGSITLISKNVLIVISVLILVLVLRKFIRRKKPA